MAPVLRYCIKVLRLFKGIHRILTLGVSALGGTSIKVLRLFKGIHRILTLGFSALSGTCITFVLLRPFEGAIRH